MSTETSPPRNPPHPGKILEYVLLKNYKMSVADLSNKADISTRDLQAIIEGKSDVTDGVADRLQHVFGIAANRLLKIQSIYNFFKDYGRRPSPQEKSRLFSNDVRRL